MEAEKLSGDGRVWDDRDGGIGNEKETSWAGSGGARMTRGNSRGGEGSGRRSPMRGGDGGFGLGGGARRDRSPCEQMSRMEIDSNAGISRTTSWIPDSGIYVTPADPKRRSPRRDGNGLRLSESTTGESRNTSSNLFNIHSSSAIPVTGKLSAEASEFVCFAVYRIWNRIPLKPSSSSSSSESLPATTTSSGLVIPLGTELWYPSFVHAVHTLIHRAGCSLPHLMIALLYVARLRQSIKTSTPTGEGAEFRVFTSALILAQKYHTDERYANKTWAKFTGLPLNDVNTMEREFLSGVGGRLHVKREEYERWLKSVQVLGVEHGRIVSRAAEVEQRLAVLREGNLMEDPDALRRARSWPERGEAGRALDRSPPRCKEV